MLAGMLIVLPAHVAQAAPEKDMARKSKSAGPDCQTYSSSEARLVPPDGSRVALVVGNQVYPYITNLTQPEADAERVAAALWKTGFNIEICFNLERRHLIEATDRFHAQLEGARISVFYFSGHGGEQWDENFLYMKDTARFTMDGRTEVDSWYRKERSESANREAVRLSAFSVGLLYEGRPPSNDRVDIIILDACRTDPFVKGEGGGLGEVNIEGTPSLAVLYSTASRRSAPDSPVFSTALASAWIEPGATVQSAFDRTRIQVSAQLPGLTPLLVTGPVSLSVPLVPLGTPAKLTIHAERGGKIRVDGRSMGEVPVGGETSLELSAGSHEVVVNAESRPVTLTAGQQARIDFKAPPPVVLPAQTSSLLLSPTKSAPKEEHLTWAPALGMRAQWNAMQVKTYGGEGAIATLGMEDLTIGHFELGGFVWWNPTFAQLAGTSWAPSIRATFRFWESDEGYLGDLPQIRLKLSGGFLPDAAPYFIAGVGIDAYDEYDHVEGYSIGYDGGGLFTAPDLNQPWQKYSILRLELLLSPLVVSGVVQVVDLPTDDYMDDSQIISHARAELGAAAMSQGGNILGGGPLYAYRSTGEESEALEDLEAPIAKPVLDSLNLVGASAFTFLNVGDRSQICVRGTGAYGWGSVAVTNNGTWATRYFYAPALEVTLGATLASRWTGPVQVEVWMNHERLFSDLQQETLLLADLALVPFRLRDDPHRQRQELPWAIPANPVTCRAPLGAWNQDLE